ncbi:hypothetical protein FRC09_007449 [Ceratobasidium sp. 395]|nr:hypothetical protein FRC09_007449 [Ceratobasidium sp. 395]
MTQQLLSRIASIQLVTVSHIEGSAESETEQVNTWFELVICRSSDSTYPRKNLVTDLEFTWRSHEIVRLSANDVRREGNIFTQSDDLLKELEENDVISVRVCIQNASVAHHAIKGKIILSFVPNNTPIHSPATYATYPFSPVGPLLVEADGATAVAMVWFTTPPLDEDWIQKMSEIQLFTKSKDQGWVSNLNTDSHSWFELLISSSPEAELPIVRDGCTLRWDSHRNPIASQEYAIHHGKVFDHTDELLRMVLPGDSIIVRVAAQYPAWQNNAVDARLEVRFSSPRG